jgi:hypothetical protein
MPAEHINFRYTVPAATGVQLAYRLKRSGWLRTGFIHFPSGCNALVYVRVLLEAKGVLRQLAPIENEYIALDDANFPFEINTQIAKDERIIVDIENYDDTFPHQISIIIAWASEVLEPLRDEELRRRVSEILLELLRGEEIRQR